MRFILSIIFSIIIISMILPVSALQQSGKPMIYDLQLGSTQTEEWILISDSDYDLILKIIKLRPGNELVSLPSEIKLPANGSVKVPVTVTIPEDYEDNIILKPKIRAIQEGVISGGAITINVAMGKVLEINIGDNPVLKVEEKPILKTTPKSDVVKDTKPPKESQPKSSFAIGGSNTKTTDSPDMDPEPTGDYTKQCGAGTKLVDGFCKVIGSEDDGGCLIATATYGTELAPQVQFLREIRDNTLFTTTSGTSFMMGFNTLYYSFAPTISDWERENPIFKETVKAFITPMLTTLSIMSLADEGSEIQVLGLGISVIALNLAMYIGMPIGAIVIFRRKYTKRYI